MKVKGGILVFFPSYSLMEQYTLNWAGNGAKLKIEREAKKKLFIEHKMQE
jgi:Rad3-related DNA helicase